MIDVAAAIAFVILLLITVVVVVRAAAAVYLPSHFIMSWWVRRKLEKKTGVIFYKDTDAYPDYFYIYPKAYLPEDYGDTATRITGRRCQVVNRNRVTRLRVYGETAR